ncbi:two-component sensor histidine kinase [Microbacterium sp. 1.5R]|uniref:sensor histidine kinase n=1 Tax=Microbacterium TaxID=33882 RepID=UPI0006A28C14|nr:MULTISPECIES: HAMP domain-containing sensor histidine kinase [unclassified Microbacterium]AKV86191.1 histidine kinase [Microbacterium sp. CGR1]APH45629.1 two-component sensor histidine kinase [Microbacterium sp. 1.5R]MBC6496307.1 two-component sensor histidine kinase [Microbacterium sp. 4-7]MDY0984513.1 HAMP domain-containing sensor histidine kinase [Microbacterium sp. CFBP9023]CAH0129080.1 Sensor protein kinase WalK [Microbacterium sp. Bi98]
MAHKPDAITRWWRSISLRAKVTGVTVAVLALGLLAAGIGTVPILRNSLISNIDAQLPALVSADLASRYFEVTVEDGETVYTPTDSPRDFFVAIYDAEGVLQTTTGNSANGQPLFPATYSPLDVQANEDTPFTMEGTEGSSFRAAVARVPGEGDGSLRIQIVAMPLEYADRIISQYFGIYITVAFVTIFLAALLTRGLVTLTFRRLGQVESTAMSIAAGDFTQRLTDLEPTTEVGRLNSAINTMLDRVDASLAQRDRTVQHMRRFIGDASHELRTPLVSVRGYAELYRMGAIKGEEDTARAMERIEKEAIRMGVLVEDLLALARLDEEREPEIEALDLRPIARDAALDLRAAAPARTVTVVDRTVEAPLIDVTTRSTPVVPSAPETPAPRGLSRGTLARLRRRPRNSGAAVPAIDFTEAADIPVRTPPIVLGEENKVRQVVTNLLGNARRFSAEESPIEIVVDADRVRGTGSIAIVDHGEGIPPQIREQIFERFWRADTSRARETGGSGLGLAIVSSIVKALHGSVAVSETPGGGATFTVTLPLAPSRATPAHLLEDTQPIEPLDI